MVENPATPLFIVDFCIRLVQLQILIQDAHQLIPRLVNLNRRTPVVRYGLLVILISTVVNKQVKSQSISYR
jgi:hypothetical protein